MNLSSLFFISLLSLLSAFSYAGEGHVGEIRYSILTQVQFQSLYGSEWEILRGQAVPDDSELRDLWGNENLPDARGVFLRSGNHGRPREEGNPEGHLPIGTYQADTFKSHDHGGGNHSHTVSFNSNGGRDNHKSFRDTVNSYHEGKHPFPSSHSGNIIREQGGIETRPRNITVNTFIKIRESAPVVQETQISAEWVTRLFESREFLRALREAITSTVRSLF